MSYIISGKQMAEGICQEIKEKVGRLKRPPSLAVVLVGDRQDSWTYVRAKQRKCKELGITSILKSFPEEVDNEEVLNAVNNLSNDKDIDGILVQLPLPDHMDTCQILNAVDPKKDVDGFHLENVGALVNGLNPICQPCTPKGIIRMLEIMDVKLQGKRVVIIGASRVVGIPLCHLFLQANATPTLCHVYTENIQSITKKADILVSACGQAQMVKADWIKEGSIVIDVGINSIPDETRKSGKRLVGDIDFEGVKEKAKAITPVPGGVGPMTIAMLMENTYEISRKMQTD